MKVLEQRIREFARLVHSVRARPDVTPLAGDASARRYFRASFPGDGESMVVMATRDTEEADDFARITSLMRNLGVDTPQLYAQAGNLLAMEDLGDRMLQDHAASLKGESLLNEYHRIIEELVRFQLVSISQIEKEADCYKMRFDGEKLRYEIDFAHAHFLKGWRKRQPSKADMAAMDRQWDKVITRLAARMECLAHRDFHSRNIMVSGGRRVWIDYQDARMGRLHYDLVSLIFDPYIDLGPELEEDLREYYFTLLEAKGAAPWGHGEFLELYWLSAAQRLYKALGTYGYQTTQKGSKVYLPYIKPAQERLIRICKENEALRQLGKLLGPLI